MAKMIKKKGKYNNSKIEIDGIMFASIKEGHRYILLKDWLKKGKIKDLVLQPSFNIAKSVILDGKKKAIRKYKADFSYIDNNGDYIVEDVKGFKTEMYKLKRHLVREIHGIEIKEL